MWNKEKILKQKFLRKFSSQQGLYFLCVRKEYKFADFLIPTVKDKTQVWQHLPETKDKLMEVYFLIG